MNGNRRLRILELLVPGRSSEQLETSRLCEVCAEVTEMTGAGIMLMSGDIPHGSACSSDEVSALIEQLQFDLGEGPCIDAYRDDRPVLEPDLREPSNPRWPAFRGPVLAAGADAVFGFPMGVGAVHLGALNMYRDRPGPLTDAQHADALVMADVAADALLMMQANAPPGQLASALADGGNFQPMVHQASGMVAGQLDVSVAQALVRLRAHAFGTGRPLPDVSADVVGRRLTFNDTSEQGPDPDRP